MLKRNKAIAIVMAFVFCMSMVATGFVAVPAALAGTTYETLSAPSVTADGTEQTLGKVKVSIPDKRVIDQTYAEYVTISLPSGLEFTDNSNVIVTSSKDESESNNNDFAILLNKKSSSTSWELGIVRSSDAADYEADLLIEFDKIKVKSGSGNIDVTFLSSGSVFPTGTATIAKIGDGSTQSMAKSVKAIGDAGGYLDTIIIRETIPNVLQPGNEIELRLPSGFSWGSISSVKVLGAWGFTRQTNLTGEFSLDVRGDDKDILVLKLNSSFKHSTSKTTAGRINIGCDVTNNDSDFLYVNVDDAAKLGEIEVNISSDNNSDVADEDIVVAKYGEFGVTVSEDEVEEVIAGHTEQKLGSFYIEEDLDGSLVEGRAIYLELPAGVKWLEVPNVKVEDGDVELKQYAGEDFTPVSNSSNRKIKATIEKGSTEASKLLIEKGEVYVEPGFEGDIEIEVSGSAGAEGTVKVAEAVKAIEFTVEDTPDVIIGQQSQQVANMIIKENKKAAIQENKNIVIELDEGFRFAKEPKVEVTEGNLEIDDVDINSDYQLVIEIDCESTKPSTIEISDVEITGLRYAPEGKVVAKLVEAEVDADKATGSTALDSLFNDEYSEKSAGEVVVANCITPAETAGGNATFRINSNIYTLNGASKVMDVAPYIKNARTYMPVRYVAYALGLTDDDIVWDAATQKVTLTKGDTVVEMTIGSTTITVNGEAQTMDVAPEITNGRTMLPARFVAEAFGYQVGWDPATQTVIISK